MDSNGGRFITTKDQGEWRKIVETVPPAPTPHYAKARINAQAQLNRIARLPTLAIGETVEIKGVKFQVTRIKADGKVGFKMVRDPDWKAA